MRRVAFVWLIFFFFLGVLIYIGLFQNPFNQTKLLEFATNKGISTDNAILNAVPYFIDTGLIWDVLEIRIFIAAVVAFFGAIVFLVAGIHLLIDKLFLRKFFEEPAMFSAFRRGFLISMVIIFPIFFRLINGFVWYNFLSVVALAICIEILTLNVMGKQKK